MARKRTLMRYMVDRVGRRKAYTLMAFCIAWNMTRAEVGDENLDVETYAKHWKVSRAQAFREQQMFRECFPDLRTPSDLLDLAKAQGVDMQYVVVP